MVLLFALNKISLMGKKREEGTVSNTDKFASKLKAAFRGHVVWGFLFGFSMEMVQIAALESCTGRAEWVGNEQVGLAGVSPGVKLCLRKLFHLCILFPWHVKPSLY